VSVLRMPPPGCPAQAQDHLQIGPPECPRGIDKNMIRRYVQQKRAQIRLLYERELTVSPVADRHREHRLHHRSERTRDRGRARAGWARRRWTAVSRRSCDRSSSARGDHPRDELPVHLHPVGG
jgi:hypothetical protein